MSSTQPLGRTATQGYLNLLIFFVAGFAALSYQIVSYKLISISGLSDATSVATSLTAFVALSAAGALLSTRISPALTGPLEILLGVYGLMVFGGLKYFGIESVFMISGTMSASVKMILFVIVVAPIAVLTGALIPLHQHRTTDTGNRSGFSAFKPVYILFHVGGAISLMLIEGYGFPLSGWPFVGCLIAAVSLVNGFTVMLYRAASLSPCYRSNTVQTHSYSLLFGLLCLSIVTGYFGISSYKAFDYLVGPNIRNYSTITAFIFLGLSLSAVLAGRLKLSFRMIAGLTGIGILLLYVGIYFLNILIPLFMNTGSSSWILYFAVAAILIIPSYALIGVSIPSAIRLGVKTEHALFVISIGNAIGYWAFIFLGQYNVDALILFVVSISLISFSSKRLVLLSIPAIIIASVPIVLDQYFATHHIILANRIISDFKVLEQNVYRLQPGTNVLEDDYMRYEFKVIGSWSSYGWTTDHVRLNGWQDDDLIFTDDYLVIDGFVSLEMSDPKRTMYAEAAAAAIPSLFAASKRKALVLGGGTGVSASLVADAFDDVTLVDISPDTNSQLSYFEPLNGRVGDKVSIVKRDALSYLSEGSQSNAEYNLIFSTVTGAGYQSSAMLYTKEFFQVAKKSLSDDGVFAFWMDDRFNQKDGAPQILSAMLSEFEYVKRIVVHPKSLWDESESDPNADLAYQVVIGSKQPLELHRESSQTIVDFLSTNYDAIHPFSDNSRYANADEIIDERRLIEPRFGVGTASPANMDQLSFAYHYYMHYERMNKIILDFRLRNGS